MNDKELNKIWKESGSHPWTDKEIDNLALMLTVIVLICIALPLVIVYQLVKAIL